TQQIEIFLWSLARKLIQQLGLHLCAQHRAHLLVPAYVDAIEFLRSRVDELLDHSALLVQTRSGQSATFHRIKHAQKMLPLAKYDLRGTHGLPLPCITHEIRTSHCPFTP